MVNIPLVIIASLSLSLGAAVGINVQKLSMNREEKSKRNRKPLFQPLWLCGMAVIILDSIGDFIFVSLAPQSLLAPLGSLSLGWNVILSPFFHNEKVTRPIILATSIIYVGTITTVIYAESSTPTYNLQRIQEFIYNPTFIEYLILCLLLQFTIYLHARRRNSFQMIHYCALAGSFGGHTILLAKVISELVKNAILEENYNDWKTSLLPYVAILSLLMTLILQVHYLNTGLAKFEAVLYVPIYQSCWTAFAITGGMIFFQEYKAMTQRDLFLYTLGIIITLLGVRLLVKQQRQRIIRRSDDVFLPLQHNNITTTKST